MCARDAVEPIGRLQRDKITTTALEDKRRCDQQIHYLQRPCSGPELLAWGRLPCANAGTGASLHMEGQKLPVKHSATQQEAVRDSTSPGTASRAPLRRAFTERGRTCHRSPATLLLSIWYATGNVNTEAKRVPQPSTACAGMARGGRANPKPIPGRVTSGTVRSTCPGVGGGPQNLARRRSDAVKGRGAERIQQVSPAPADGPRRDSERGQAWLSSPPTRGPSVPSEAHDDGPRGAR